MRNWDEDQLGIFILLTLQFTGRDIDSCGGISRRSSGSLLHRNRHTCWTLWSRSWPPCCKSLSSRFQSSGRSYRDTGWRGRMAGDPWHGLGRMTGGGGRGCSSSF